MLEIVRRGTFHGPISDSSVGIRGIDPDVYVRVHPGYFRDLTAKHHRFGAVELRRKRMVSRQRYRDYQYHC
jgi:hypothetical protein